MAFLHPEGRAVGVLASRVHAEPLHWLWPGRIPFGKLTLLDGDPGLGKSLLTLDLAVRLTTGREMPDGTPPQLDGPAGVVLLSAEDDLASTILPRLAAAGADLDRVFVLQGVRFPVAVAETDASRRAVAEANGTGTAEIEQEFTIPRDIPVLEQAIARVTARLLVIDPLVAYLDASVNSWNDQAVRTALRPLVHVAQATGVAVVALRHLNKGGAGGGSAVYRGGGSIDFIANARGPARRQVAGQSPI